MRCIVVDDEAPAREEIKYLLQKYNDIEIIGEAEDGKGACELVAKAKPDVVFLDIQMRGMSGFEVACELYKQEAYPLIVFITAYDQYAIKAFEINAVDYLLKPISVDRLNSTIERLQNIYKRNKTNSKIVIEELLKYINKPRAIQKISVYSNGKHIPLDPQEIIFVGVEGRNTVIKSKKGDYISNLSLSELEEKLKDFPFFRSHRSFLVNLEEIQEIDHWFHGTYQITMKGYSKDKIPVSRSNAQKFREMMNL
ncbi:DNA-binding LytR/AlgR family response regulator [Anaerosolibacter carboniphilus]|uniref:Stage 0 sporulation protein A homolog n=1 Tax=Anaerosolibacter carboniphilus TaxID=1417629 RepID=A0A841KQA3_9FIRM|nr:LytTR family DNA-binding domain-containing protein [Anaerosolibacter carboniphilus]MBB6215666.1 DNA-binding LytR/AlgR family response regulator [Anaerosolibacter carboniphilus]